MASTWLKTLHNLRHLQESGILCDCSIVCRDYEITHITFQAHSALLAASSKYFYEKFVTLVNKNVGTILIPDLDTKCVAVVINFIYGELPTTMEDTDSLRKGGKYLMVTTALEYLGLAEKEGRKNTVVKRPIVKRSTTKKRKKRRKEGVTTVQISENLGMERMSVKNEHATKYMESEEILIMEEHGNEENDLIDVSGMSDMHVKADDQLIMHDDDNAGLLPPSMSKDEFTEKHRVVYKYMINRLCNNEVSKRAMLITKPKKKTTGYIDAKCPFCKKRITSITYLIKHITMMHLYKELEQTCPLCGIIKKTNTIHHRHQMSLHVARHLIDVHETDSMERFIPQEIPQKTMCPYCDETFVYLKLLKKHVVEYHLDGETQDCPFCEFTEQTVPLYRKNQLISHILYHYLVPDAVLAKHNSEDGPPLHKSKLGLAKLPHKYGECHNCFAVFTHNQAYTRHINRCGSGNLRQKCILCKTRTDDIGAMIQHLQSNHANIKYFACCVCSDVFTSEKKISEHFGEAHSLIATYAHLKYIRAVVTPFNNEFYTQQLLKCNDNDMSKMATLFIEYYFCSLCERVFESQSDLVADISAHVIDTESEVQVLQYKQYECHMCGEMTHALKDINAHIAEFHEGENGQQVFLCKVCGAKFIKDSLLQSHMKTHSEMSHICAVCGKQFRFLQSLRRHKEVHDWSLRKYPCSYCDFRANNQYQLEGHENFHLGITPFQCSMCDCTYPGRSGLYKHMKDKHSGLSLI